MHVCICVYEWFIKWLAKEGNYFTDTLPPSPVFLYTVPSYAGFLSS